MSNASVIVPLALSAVFFVTFVIWELRYAAEPMLAPFLLKQKIPVLVGISNFLVANCNFAVTYFFPMWFQTVMLTSASEAGTFNMSFSIIMPLIFLKIRAGLHLLPNSVSMSIGSMFAGYVSQLETISCC
jgi:hypothetical protein